MQITPTESAAEEVSFEWSNRKISSTDSKLKLKSAILSFTKGDVKRHVGLLMKE